MNRVGMAFHESFYLNRPAMVEILNVIGDYQGASIPLSEWFERFKARTTLGNNYIKAMPRYCVAAGLMYSDYTFTPVGEIVREFDPLLESSVSQWVIHLHLTFPQGPGPLFWHHLIANCSPGMNVTVEEVRDQIGRMIQDHGGKLPAQRTLQSTANIFLRTYAEADGLKSLRIVSVDEGEYLWMVPTPPSVSMFGFALISFWNSIYGEQRTISEAELTSDEGLASIMIMGQSNLTRMIDELSDKGLIDIYRSAPPYQIVRQWEDGAELELLRNAYATAID